MTMLPSSTIFPDDYAALQLCLPGQFCHPLAPLSQTTCFAYDHCAHQSYLPDDYAVLQSHLSNNHSNLQCHITR